MKKAAAKIAKKGPTKTRQKAAASLNRSSQSLGLRGQEATSRLASGSIRYVTIDRKIGRPSKITISSQPSKMTRSVRIFTFNSSQDIVRYRSVLQAEPIAKQPAIAVVSAKMFNEPDVRVELKRSYSEILVKEGNELEASVLEKWKSVLDDMLNHIGTPSSATVKDPASEADLTDLSARLRDPKTGRLDAKKISDLLGISMTSLATRVCRITKQALNQSPASSGIQEKLQALEDVSQLLFWCAGDEGKLRAWLKRPNRDFPEMEGKIPSPMDLILCGHADIVARKVHNLRTGHPA
jgi:hypothetical protein